MSAFHPGNVCGSDKLVIAEEEWVPSIIVADIGPTTVDLERGDAALQKVGAVSPGNLQHFQAEVPNDIKALSAQVLACVAEVCVQNNRGTEGVGAADSDDINRARGCSQLPPV